MIVDPVKQESGESALEADADLVAESALGMDVDGITQETTLGGDVDPVAHADLVTEKSALGVNVDGVMQDVDPVSQESALDADAGLVTQESALGVHVDRVTEEGALGATQDGSNASVDAGSAVLAAGSVENGSASLAQMGPPALAETLAAWKGQMSTLGSHLFAGFSIAAVVKVACMVGNLLTQVSPMPQVKQWQGMGSTGHAEAAPFVTMALGCWQWCTYGFSSWWLSGNDGFLVLVYSNCVGALLGCYYTFTFHRHCRDTGASTNLWQTLAAVGVLVVAQSGVWLLLPHSQALLVHSFIAGGCSFLGAASLLTGLPAVLRTGDTSGICGPLILANFFGAFLWVYWGVLMSNPVIIASNTFAGFSSSICLYMKYLHEARKAQPDVAMGKMHQPWVTNSPAFKALQDPTEL